MNREEVYNPLEGVEFIDDLQIKENCPCIYSIWKKMKNIMFTPDNVNDECTVLSILNDFLVGPLQAEFGIAQIPLTNTNLARTYPNTTNIGNGMELLLFNSRIEFNKELCDNIFSVDPKIVAGTFLHELIHARIFNSLYVRGYLSKVNTQSLRETWNQFVQSNYPNIVPPGQDQHKLMAQIYVNDIAEALFVLNGSVGQPSDYLYIAWQGLDKYIPEELLNDINFMPDFGLLKSSYDNNIKGKGFLEYNGCN